MSCKVKNIYFLNFYKKKFSQHCPKWWFNGKIASINLLVVSGYISWSKNVILDISKAKGSEVLTKVWKAMIYVEKYFVLNLTLSCRVSVPIFKKRFNMNFIFISMRLCHLLVVVFSTTLSVPAIVLILVIYGLCERQNVCTRWKIFFSWLILMHRFLCFPWKLSLLLIHSRTL